MPPAPKTESDLPYAGTLVHELKLLQSEFHDFLAFEDIEDVFLRRLDGLHGFHLWFASFFGISAGGVSADRSANLPTDAEPAQDG